MTAGRLKILVDARHLAPPWTGVGRFGSELLRELGRLPEAHLGILTTPDIRAHLASQGLPSEGPSARFASTQHPFVELESSLRIGRVVRAWGPDLVWGPAFDGSAIPAGIPGIVNVHDLACFHHRDTMKARFAWLLRRKVRRAQAAGAVLLASSQAVLDELRAELPGARLALARDGVGEGPLQVTDQDVVALRRRVPLPEEFLLTVGGMHPRKQVGRLIAALEGVPEAPPLVVVGAPAPPPSPRVLPLGFCDDADLPGLYRAARLVVHPARYEGFGLPPLEALAAGTPAIGTATGAIPEFLTEADELVATDDPAAWVAAIRAQLGRPLDAARRTRLRQRAQAWTWQASALEHLAVFREVAAAGV